MLKNHVDAQNIKWIKNCDLIVDPVDIKNGLKLKTSKVPIAFSKN